MLTVLILSNRGRSSSFCPPRWRCWRLSLRSSNKTVVVTNQSGDFWKKSLHARNGRRIWLQIWRIWYMAAGAATVTHQDGSTALSDPVDLRHRREQARPSSMMVPHISPFPLAMSSS